MIAVAENRVSFFTDSYRIRVEQGLPQGCKGGLATRVIATPSEFCTSTSGKPVLRKVSYCSLGVWNKGKPVVEKSLVESVMAGIQSSISIQS